MVSGWSAACCRPVPDLQVGVRRRLAQVEIEAILADPAPAGERLEREALNNGRAVHHLDAHVGAHEQPLR